VAVHCADIIQLSVKIVHTSLDIKYPSKSSSLWLMKNFQQQYHQKNSWLQKI
jgi:hypothetical protein